MTPFSCCRGFGHRERSLPMGNFRRERRNDRNCVGLQRGKNPVETWLLSASAGSPSGRSRRVEKGALRMNLWVRQLRGLCLVGVVLAGMSFCTAIGAVATARPMRVSPDPPARSSSKATAASRRRPSAPISSVNPGERLDSYKIDQALKALYATGLFQDVRINQSGGRLIVTVVENPVINRVAFEGNSKVKDDQLANEVQSKTRGTLSRPTVQADVQRIVEIYRRNGRFDVRVEPKIIDLPNNRVDLVFEINEGDKTGVKKINFVGNKAYNDQRLKDEIKTIETSWFWLLAFLQTGRHLRSRPHRSRPRPAAPLLSQARLCRRARRLGGVGLRSGARRASSSPSRSTRARAIGSARSTSSSNVADGRPAVALRRSRVGAGDVYNAEAVEKSVENMSIEVARRGYPFAVVRPRGDRDAATTPSTVVFTVEDGPRVYIERINVRGNTRTRDYVIRREFDIGEGDAYNRALVDRAERRLKNLNYFKTVKITNEPGSAPDRVVLNVDVEEMPTGEFSVSGGYSTASGWMAEAQRRRAQSARPGPVRQGRACTYGQYARGVELSFAEPYLPGPPARRRRRSLRQADACDELHLLQQPDGRRRTARPALR